MKILVAFASQLMKPDVFLASFLQNHGQKTAGLLIEKQINALCHSLMGPQELFGEILRRKVRQMTPRWMSRSPLYLGWPGALSWFFQKCEFEHRPSFMHSNGVPGELLRILPLRGKVRNEVMFVCALCFQATN